LIITEEKISMKIKYGGWFYKIVSPSDLHTPETVCGVVWQLLMLYVLAPLVVVVMALPFYSYFMGDLANVFGRISWWGVAHVVGMYFNSLLLYAVVAYCYDNIDFTKYCGKVEITHGENGDD
jgi:NhaP-type Na+/H+ and K+/H+ antiporter